MSEKKRKEFISGAYIHESNLAKIIKDRYGVNIQDLKTENQQLRKALEEISTLAYNCGIATISVVRIKNIADEAIAEGR